VVENLLSVPTYLRNGFFMASSWPTGWKVCWTCVWMICGIICWLFSMVVMRVACCWGRVRVLMGISFVCWSCGVRPAGGGTTGVVVTWASEGRGLGRGWFGSISAWMDDKMLLTGIWVSVVGWMSWLL
jgi:hypothetical protein